MLNKELYGIVLASGTFEKLALDGFSGLCPKVPRIHRPKTMVNTIKPKIFKGIEIGLILANSLLVNLKYKNANIHKMLTNAMLSSV